MTSKVVAYNSYGDSLESELGSGAVLVTYPDPPINVGEDVTKRGATHIGLVWEDGASNGGTSIIDYEIWYDQGIYDYVYAGTTVLN